MTSSNGTSNVTRVLKPGTMFPEHLCFVFVGAGWGETGKLSATVIISLTGLDGEIWQVRLPGPFQAFPVET